MKLPIAALAVSLTCGLFAQPQDGYLDYFAVRVKPDKRAEFDAITKRMADANRRNNGDNWIAGEVIFGEGNQVVFVSQRPTYAAIEQGMAAFMGSLAKAFGPAGMAKLLQDGGATYLSSRGELRRRRPDLSANPLTDPAALNRLIGESRYFRTVSVRVRSGRSLDYEAQLREVKAAVERSGPNRRLFVSQSAAGTEGTRYYLTSVTASLADFDSIPTPRQTLGEQAYANFLRRSADNVVSNDTIIGRYLPELSNPPDAIAAASPDFWRPMAAAPAKPKPKAAAPPK